MDFGTFGTSRVGYPGEDYFLRPVFWTGCAANALIANSGIYFAECSDEGGEGVEDQEEEEDEDEEAAAVPHKKARAPVPWIEVEKTTAVEAEKW